MTFLFNKAGEVVVNTVQQGKRDSRLIRHIEEFTQCEWLMDALKGHIQRCQSLIPTMKALVKRQINRMESGKDPFLEKSEVSSGEAETLCECTSRDSLKSSSKSKKPEVLRAVPNRFGTAFNFNSFHLAER